MIFLSSRDYVIGEPTSSKSVRSGNIHNAFRNFQNEPDEDSKCISIDNKSMFLAKISTTSPVTGLIMGHP